MNERIKELAWSIGIAGKNLQGQIDTDWNQIEKLAELIVQKCAHIAEVNQAENMGWNIGEIIKEHFGVER